MKNKDILIAVLISFIWGVNFVFTKIGLKDFPPIFFTCLRYTAIVFPCIFFVSRSGLPWKLIILMGIFLGTLTFTFAFIGMSLGVPAGLTSLIMQSQVIFTMILSAVWLKDIPNANQKIGVFISFIGIFLLALEFWKHPSFIGFLFVLLGAFSSAIVKIIMKKGGDYDTFRMMIWMSIIPPIPLLITSLFFEQDQLHSLQNASYIGWSSIFYNAFISTVLGFGYQAYLIKKYSPVIVTPYTLLVPVFGLISGYLVLGENLNLPVLLACLIIFLGLLYPTYIYKFLNNFRANKGK